MMRRYEQGSSHRLKAVGFRPNYAEGIFMKQNPFNIYYANLGYILYAQKDILLGEEGLFVCYNTPKSSGSYMRSSNGSQTLSVFS